MLRDYRISLYVILGGLVVIYVVFSFPALTASGNKSSTGVSEAEFERTVRQEMAYCRQQPEDINCQCFANLSGQILTHRTNKVHGATYADRQDLARGQAARAC